MYVIILKKNLKTASFVLEKCLFLRPCLRPLQGLVNGLQDLLAQLDRATAF